MEDSCYIFVVCDLEPVFLKTTVDNTCIRCWASTVKAVLCWNEISHKVKERFIYSLYHICCIYLNIHGLR